MIAIKENNDLPYSTGMDNHVNTNTTVAAGARKPPPRPKTGKPAGTGRPAPTTYVVKPKKIVTSGSWSASTRTIENRSQDRAILAKPEKIVISGSWRTVENRSQDCAVHGRGGIERKYNVTEWDQKRARWITRDSRPSNYLPSSTGINNYVNTNTAMTGADKARPRPQTDGPAGTGRSASPAVGPSRGRPQTKVAVEPLRGRPEWPKMRLGALPVVNLHIRDSQTRRRGGPTPGATLQPPPTAGRVPGPRPTRESARRAGRPRPTPSPLGTSQKTHQQFIGPGRPCQTTSSRNTNRLPGTTGTETTAVATRATRQPQPPTTSD